MLTQESRNKKLRIFNFQVNASIKILLTSIMFVQQAFRLIPWKLM